jgi:hypothetical protein
VTRVTQVPGCAHAWKIRENIDNAWNKEEKREEGGMRGQGYGVRVPYPDKPILYFSPPPYWRNHQAYPR